MFFLDWVCSKEHDALQGQRGSALDSGSCTRVRDVAKRRLSEKPTVQVYLIVRLEDQLIAAETRTRKPVQPRPSGTGAERVGRTIGDQSESGQTQAQVSGRGH